MNYEEVLKFWFDEIAPKDQFTKNTELDVKIRNRFASTLESALRGELFDWRKNPDGRLAEIIVIDQFSRNIFRDDLRAFAGDAMALTLAQEAISCGVDLKIPVSQRAFLYMPLMHSESALVHTEAIKVFSQPGLENNLNFEIRHKKIIDQFNRFPHRNKILGRISTPEEIEFLKQPGSGF